LVWFFIVKSIRWTTRKKPPFVLGSKWKQEEWGGRSGRMWVRDERHVWSILVTWTNTHTNTTSSPSSISILRLHKWSDALCTCKCVPWGGSDWVKLLSCPCYPYSCYYSDN
jgi:hypothetical protein